MVFFSILLLAVSAALALMAALIYRGNTKLIHDYHQQKVTHQAAYGKAFGKALGVFAAAPFLSGVIALLGEAFAMVAVGVLLVGFLIGILCIIKVQKKYNGGVF